jgi:hypothetical protein
MAAPFVPWRTEIDLFKENLYNNNANISDGNVVAI